MARSRCRSPRRSATCRRRGRCWAAASSAEAFVEAQAAVDVAPESLDALTLYGNLLERMGRRDEARAAFVRALAIARTMEPSAQETRVPDLERRIAGQEEQEER